MLAVYELQAQLGEIDILPMMVKLLIDTYRTTEHQPGRLRGELTSQEIKTRKDIAMCLKPGPITIGMRVCNFLVTRRLPGSFLNSAISLLHPRCLWERIAQNSRVA